MRQKCSAQTRSWLRIIKLSKHI